MARMIIKESEIRQYVRSLIRETIEAEARGKLSDEEKAVVASELQKMRSGQPFNIQHFPSGGNAIKEFGQMLKDRGVKKPGKKNNVKPYLFQFTNDGIINLTPEHSDEYAAQRDAQVKQNRKEYDAQNKMKSDDAKRYADKYGMDYKDVMAHKNISAFNKHIKDNNLQSREGFRILDGDEQLKLSPEELEQYRNELRQHEMDKQSNSYDKYRGLQLDLSSHASPKELIDKLARVEDEYRRADADPFIDRRGSRMSTAKRVEKDIVRILGKYHGMKPDEIASILNKQYNLTINDVLGNAKIDASSTLDDFDLDDFDLGDEYDGSEEKAQASADKAKKTANGETVDDDDDDIANDTTPVQNDDSLDDDFDDPQFYRDDYESLDDVDDNDDDYDEDGIMKYNNNNRSRSRNSDMYGDNDDYDYSY